MKSLNKIGFIGLGTMGGPMAGHLIKKGYKLYVFNRSKEKIEKWSSKYMAENVCSSIKELAINCQIIILCVGDDADVRGIINEIFDSLNPGTIIIDHTTTSAQLPMEMLDKVNKKDSFFLDAPISGGEIGAQKGNLSVMVGGNKEVYLSIKKILEAYSKHSKFMGPSGHGQLTKMVNQICIAGLIQSLAEGLHFSKKAGLQTEDVIEVISQGAAQSWQMDNRWKSMIMDDYDHGFAVDLMRKDLDIVLAHAKTLDTNLEVTELVNSFYKNIQKLGGGKWDTSSLLKRLET